MSCNSLWPCSRWHWIARRLAPKQLWDSLSHLSPLCPRPPPLYRILILLLLELVLPVFDFETLKGDSRPHLGNTPFTVIINLFALLFELVQGLQILILLHDLFIPWQQIEVFKQNPVVVKRQQKLKVIQNLDEKRIAGDELLIHVVVLGAVRFPLKLLLARLLLLNQVLELLLARGIPQIGPQQLIVQDLLLVLSLYKLNVATLNDLGFLLDLQSVSVRNRLENLLVYFGHCLRKFIALFAKISKLLLLYLQHVILNSCIFFFMLSR